MLFMFLFYGINESLLVLFALSVCTVLSMYITLQEHCVFLAPRQVDFLL